MEPNVENGTGAAKPTDDDRPRFRFSQRTREPQSQPQQEQRHGSNRETIESVVIAFVLAFLFRTFEAEAFVIPTGSMAPTLMGRHKEVACTECGWVFTVGDSEDQSRRGTLTQGICPNCRFVNDIEEQPAFKGDRILVLKSLYDLPGWAPDWLREPKRWDVVVFKFPEEPQINYIKRLVGLPNEELRIHYGNIYTRTDPASEFQIARKPAEKQKVMRMLVYDNNHQSPTWKSNGWPNRWQSEPGEQWKESDDGHAFTSPTGLSESTEWARLSYHHASKTWGTSDPGDSPPREQLITDFYGYNADLRDSEPQPHWVGDLALGVRVDVTAAKGKLRVELVEAGDQFVCEFDLVGGTCALLRITPSDIAEQVLATTRHGIVRPGRYSICFGNTDDRLTVWLDDKLLFGDGHDYDGARLDDRQRPTPTDLRPASVAVQGTHVRVSDLVLYRDIYYTFGAGSMGGYEYDSHRTDPSYWSEVLSEPDQWGVFTTARVSEFKRFGPDEFMMMGDNSPRSKDGRLWEQGARRWVEDLARERRGSLYPDETEQELAVIAAKPGGRVVLSPEHVVNRQLLIGRAFYVYWPHGVPFGPDWLQFDTPTLGPLGSFRLPFYPNISRMKMIE